MRSSSILIALVVGCVSVVKGQISRQECISQGGQIVGDIGNGAIFEPTYVCDSNGMPPIAVVVASPEEPIATDGEVCCGDGDGDSPSETSTLSEDECATLGGIPVDDSIGCEDQLPALGVITTTPARQGVLCCPSGLPPSTTDRAEYTRQECMNNNGTIVGDIGDGAIFLPDYICESNGLPPIANILQDTQPFAIEGEVCCGLEENIDLFGDALDEVREEVSRQECIEMGGQIVGDIGDGATRRDDYLCESNGEPPVANIVPDVDEPIAIEGEVCCGNSTMETVGDLNATMTNDSTDVNSLLDGDGAFNVVAGVIGGAAMLVVTALSI
jgi:hypothetical protein